MSKNTASIEIDANPEAVWGVVSDASRLTDWRSPVKQVEGLDPAGPLAAGSKLDVALGNVGGARISIKEAQRARKLRWHGGPFMAHMMRMPMKVELTLEPNGDHTNASITFKSNPMIAPLMRKMSGLDFSDEAPATVQALKRVVEAKN